MALFVYLALDSGYKNWNGEKVLTAAAFIKKAKKKKFWSEHPPSKPPSSAVHLRTSIVRVCCFFFLKTIVIPNIVETSLYENSSPALPEEQKQISGFLESVACT